MPSWDPEGSYSEIRSGCLAALGPGFVTRPVVLAEWVVVAALLVKAGKISLSPILPASTGNVQGATSNGWSHGWPTRWEQIQGSSHSSKGRIGGNPPISPETHLELLSMGGHSWPSIENSSKAFTVLPGKVGMKNTPYVHWQGAAQVALGWERSKNGQDLSGPEVHGLGLLGSVMGLRGE